MKHYTLTPAITVFGAAVALSACSSPADPTPTETPEEVSEPTQESSAEETSDLDPELMELVERERDAFPRFMQAEEGSPQEAKSEIELDGIYTEIDEIVDLGSLEELPEELETLAAEEFFQAAGTSLLEVIEEGGTPWSEEEDPTETNEIGEPYEVRDWYSGSPLGEITVNSIELSHGDYQYENEQYLVLEVTTEAYPDALEDLWVSVWDLYILDEDGNLYRDQAHSTPAWTYEMELGSLEDVPPGAQHTGYLVLDTPVETGTVVYDGADESMSWEF